MVRYNALLGILAGCLFPVAASASTVSSDGTSITYRSGSAASDLVATIRFPPPATFLDVGDPIVAGPGCQPGSPVTCPIGDLTMSLGGGNDRAKVAAPLSGVVGAGGSGDDQIYAFSLFGLISGGAGDDVLIQDIDGRAIVGGDSGSDTVWGHGAGADVDGAAGDDLVVGDGTVDDDVSGGGGRDVVAATRPQASGTLSGGDGADVVVAPTDSAVVAGQFTLDGGSGHDIIRGAQGADTVSGGTGDDIVDVSGDTATDTVSCGAGADVVYADAQDSIGADCEQVVTGAMPPSATLDAALGRIASLRATVAAIDPNALTPGPLPGF
jgi:hypothetical protein